MERLDNLELDKHTFAFHELRSEPKIVTQWLVVQSVSMFVKLNLGIKVQSNYGVVIRISLLILRNLSDLCSALDLEWGIFTLLLQVTILNIIFQSRNRKYNKPFKNYCEPKNLYTNNQMWWTKLHILIVNIKSANTYV